MKKKQQRLQQLEQTVAEQGQLIKELMANVLTLSKSVTQMAQSIETLQQEEMAREKIAQHEDPTNEYGFLNGKDVAKIIREHPDNSNSEIGKLVGCTHQAITAWKRQHADLL